MSPGRRAQRRGRRLRVHLPVFLLLLGVILLVAAIRLWHPFSTARHRQEELARLRAQKAELEARRRELTEYQNNLASDRGQEAVARQEGYVKPGERRLVFVREKPKDKSKTESRK